MRNSSNHIVLDFAAQIIFPSLLDSSFWVNFASAILFIIGLCLAFRRVPSRSSGLDRIIPFGPVFFAVPLAVFGIQHFVLFNTVKFGVPDWMPGRFFWAWIVGAALIAACLSLLADIKADLAALLVGIMLVLFVLLIYLPNLVKNPHDRFAIIVPLRDLALSGGALAFAGGRGAAGRRRPVRWLVDLGRWFFAAPMVVFGVEYFLHPESAPGVPLERPMPAWVPAHLLLSYSVGVVLVVCGASILINRRARLATILLGIAYLLLVLFIYVPMEIIHPSIEISGELDYVADTLAMSGAALLVAGALEALNKRMFSNSK
jgi:uncharacterized membrane protein